MNKDEAREILQPYPLRFKTKQEALDYVNALSRHEIPQHIGILPFRFNSENKKYEANPEYLDAHYEISAIYVPKEDIVPVLDPGYPVQNFD